MGREVNLSKPLGFAGTCLFIDCTIARGDCITHSALNLKAWKTAKRPTNETPDQLAGRVEQLLSEQILLSE
jgi:hypothetical protein